MINGFLSTLLYHIREELFYFCNKNVPHLCGLWRFANAYTALTMRGKSPNWLLGTLFPTTYILGGAVSTYGIKRGCKKIKTPLIIVLQDS